MPTELRITVPIIPNDVTAPDSPRRGGRFAPRAVTALLLAAVIASGSPGASAATLEVRFSGLPSDDGRALFALFDGEGGFPDRSETALARVAGPVFEGRAGAVFENVEPGDYALSALHDVNESGGIDLNLFGMPTEKFGVSNVVTGRPTWPDARFRVGEDDVVIELEPLRFF